MWTNTSSNINIAHAFLLFSIFNADVGGIDFVSTNVLYVRKVYKQEILSSGQRFTKQ